MAKKITQKELKHDEFIDAAFDFGHWLEENWAKVAAGLGIGVVVTIAIVLWLGWARQNVEKDRARLAEAIDRYEQAESGGFADRAGLEEALASFDEIAGSGVGPGRLARFYRGAALFHLDRLDQARADLEEVAAEAGPTDTLGATAQLFLARVELASGKSDAAIALLDGIAAEPAAAVPPGQALLELARIHEQEGRPDDARAAWQRILDEHPTSAAATEARTRLQ